MTGELRSLSSVSKTLSLVQAPVLQLRWFLFAVSCFFVVSWGEALTLPQSSPGSAVYVGQQRVRFHPSSDRSSTKHPIILLGGMAQTIASWDHHVAGLSRDRDLLVCECLGQGPEPPHRTDIDLRFGNITLPAQAERLCDTIHQVFPTYESVDIVGFSLGGRVAMAVAASDSSINIRKMHLTGVAAQRSSYGKVVMESWSHLLSHKNTQGFAWSALLATYSPGFLHSNQERLASWVQHVQDSNTSQGLKCLLEQTSPVLSSDPWSTRSMAERIKRRNAIRGRLIVGELDCMAPIEEAKALLATVGWDGHLGMFENAGHAVPMEQPRLWRKDVLSFLNEQ